MQRPRPQRSFVAASWSAAAKDSLFPQAISDPIVPRTGVLGLGLYSSGTSPKYPRSKLALRRGGVVVVDELSRAKRGHPLRGRRQGGLSKSRNAVQ
jgi:hypothetical protein